MKLLHFSLLLMVALCWTACSTFYIPSQPNVTLMSQGDEAQVALAVGSNGYGMQLAYSPYYHWVIAGAGNMYAIVQDSNFVIKDRHIYGEIATGYYTRLSEVGRLEFLVGYGTGSSGLTIDRGLYRKLFLQPSMGISGPFVDAAITPRIAWVSHYENRVGGTPAEVDDSAVYLEPFFTFRGGWEQIKFQLQTGYSFELGNPAYSHQGFVGALGVHITLFKDFENYRR